MSNASAEPTIPSVPIPNIVQITKVLDVALALPEDCEVKKPLVDAVREVLIDYVARASVAVFLEDNVKYMPTETLLARKGL
jgi:hypothetical protein